MLLARGDCPSNALHAGLDRPGGEGRLAGLDLRQHRGSPGDARLGRNLGRDGRRAQSRARLASELGAEALRAGLDVTRGRLVVAGRAQAADEEDVGVLVVRVEPDELRRVPGRALGLSASEQGERGLVEDGARRARDMTALVLEPHLEAGARAEAQAVQQLVAETGKRDGLRPGAPAEDVDVDERPGPATSDGADRRRARRRRRAGRGAPRASSAGFRADRPPRGRAGSPAARVTGGAGCGGGRRAGPTPSGRAGRPPPRRRVPFSAARGGECSGRSRASGDHTFRHTPHCDALRRRVQHGRKGVDMHGKIKLAVLGALVLAASFATTAEARQFSAWEPAQKIDEIAGNSSELNTPFLDGCPIQSPDGLSLYMASNRPGGMGLLDIWVARRPHRHAPWGAPGEPGRAGQLGCGRLLSDARSAAAASSSSAGRRSRGAAGWATSTSRATPGGTAGASRSASPARPTGRTARSTSRALPTWRSAGRRRSSSRGAPRQSPATSSSARASPVGTSVRPRLSPS